MKMMLRIELRSDLCAGAGKHYAAIVDTDTAIDEYGFPYIPSKRIKDCMREIAELFLEDKEINRIFGESGSNYGGTLILNNAKIENYKEELEKYKIDIDSGKMRANDVTEKYCSVRAETSIENDTVKDGSLHFTRVVNRFSPDNKPLVFCSAIEFEDQDEDYIEKICKGLRNIGYKRNRGFGYVKCTLAEYEDSFEYEEKKDYDDNEKYRLIYRVYFEDAIMLPSNSANSTLDYIPGTSVLGAFAAKYVKDKKEEFDQEKFNRIFFSSNVKFSNLYISDENGNEFYPAPRFLAKIKAANEEQKGIHNMIAEWESYNNKVDKPQYKPLKKGYINESAGYKEPKTEVVYHNAINTKESKENNGGLYTQHCLIAGQYFRGSIEADGASMKELYSLLSSGTVFFGRSKTAQYSHCKVIIDEKPTEIKEDDKESVSGIGAFICESDVILFKDGRYSVELDDLKNEFKSIFNNITFDFDEFERFTSLSSSVVSGYNTKWNLKKPQFPVIQAGSIVLFKAEGSECKVPKSFYIGEKQNEGYGKIRFINDATEYKVTESKPAKDDYETKPYDAILDLAIENGKEKVKGLNASQIGRLMLMCKESNSFVDFSKRINSIKTETYKDKAVKLFEKEKLPIEVKDDWEKTKYYIIKTLTVAKYNAKGDK